MRRSRVVTALLVAVALAALTSACGREDANEQDGGGASAETIKIGGTFPLSGQLAAYGAVAEGARAYFGTVNAEGGIDGRDIEFIALDDGYDPARTLQSTQRLVEQDDVLSVFGTLGTPTNLAIRDYLNARRVPHLFPYTGAPGLVEDPVAHRYTILGLPDYTGEGKVYGEYLKEERPGAKVAVLYQNDDYGKSILKGFESAIEGSDVRIVASESYEATAPTVDAETTKLSRSGADVFLNIASSKFASQAIKRIGELGWRPLQIVNSPSSSKSTVLEPAGLENARGILSIQYFMDPETPRWADEPAMQEFREAMAEHAPKGDPDDPKAVQGWIAAEMLVAALREMREVSREALIEAAHQLDSELPLLLPGVRVTTSPDNGYSLDQLQIQRFDGRAWQPEGELIPVPD